MAWHHGGSIYPVGASSSHEHFDSEACNVNTIYRPSLNLQSLSLIYTRIASPLLPQDCSSPTLTVFSYF